MTNAQRKAHARLQAMLPSKTHRCMLDAERRSTRDGGWVAGTPKAVLVEGKPYGSITEAAQKTGISRQNIYRRIDRGWDGYEYAESYPQQTLANH